MLRFWRSSSNGSGDPTVAAREQMVKVQLRGNGIHDPAVLAAMGEIPRHLFVPPERVSEAYEDRPIQISAEATLSQPYIVALMTQELRLQSTDRVLDIGSGSGYQTAILARLAAQVYAIDIDAQLTAGAQRRLESLGLAGKVEFRVANGRAGWPEAAPFDAILVAACAREFPQPLFDQLNEGGRIVYPESSEPVAEADQRLYMATKVEQQPRLRFLGYCRFVPLL